MFFIMKIFLLILRIIKYIKMVRSETKTVAIDKNLIAKCGLYCGACNKYLNGKCPGCEHNTNASWCKIRLCCTENGYKSCADCVLYKDIKQCGKFNNLMSKLFGILFNSDRNACIERIRELGYEQYAAEMAQNETHTIKKP
jgi:hypothetical protein